MLGIALGTTEPAADTQPAITLDTVLNAATIKDFKGGRSFPGLAVQPRVGIDAIDAGQVGLLGNQ